jgi:hypothetical protein
MICAAGGLIVFTGNTARFTPDVVSDALGGLIPALDNSELKDPYSGTDGVPKWAADGNGLYVTIVSALTDDWQLSFDLAIADWASGSPNAVDITVESAPHDLACETEDGKVKVCNGDYGDVKWRGVSEAVLDSSNEIVSNVVKMNEYYLLNREKGAWQYTMCHELGTILCLRCIRGVND